MSALTLEELNKRGFDVISSIDYLLLNSNIIDDIQAEYIKISNKLSITEEPLHTETKLRLHYECLCFSAFLAMLMSSKFVTEKKWFIKRPSKKLNERFHGALGIALAQFCHNMEMIKLREITIIEFSPKLKSGYGEYLNPIARIDEYCTAHDNEVGSEMERFTKLIGMSLNAPHYPSLGLLFSPVASLLVNISQMAMQNVFEGKE